MTGDLSSATWRTSSFTGQGANCVEVARLAAIAGIRDSKLGDASPTLVFPVDSFKALLARLA